MMALIFIGVPVAVYLSLCTLGAGRSAAIGVTVALAAVVGLWLAVPEGPSGAFVRVLAGAVGGAVVAAGFVQAVRPALPPGAPAWVWPGLVGMTLLAGLAALVRYLGG